MKTEKGTYLTVILPNCYSSEEVQHQALNLLFVYSPTIYTVRLKNVPSLTGYRLNIYPPIFTIFGTGHQRRRFWHAAHGCVAPYVDIIRGK